MMYMGRVETIISTYMFMGCQHYALYPASLWLSAYNPMLSDLFSYRLWPTFK